jgi:hypothetical protein
VKKIFLCVYIICSLYKIFSEEFEIVEKVFDMTITELDILNEKYENEKKKQLITESFLFNLDETREITVLELEMINKTYNDVKTKIANISNYYIIFGKIGSIITICYKRKKEPPLFRWPFVIYEILFDVDISTKDIIKVYYGR